MELDCTHCDARMTRTPTASGECYYRCPRCRRTYAAAYGEVFRRAAGARPAAQTPPRKPDDRFAEVKGRLESFLRRLDESDPYQVLGLAPGSSLEQLRSRYRELALVHHPDRGGDPEQMRRLGDAYEAVRRSVRQPVSARALSSNPTPRPNTGKYVTKTGSSHAPRRVLVHVTKRSPGEA